MSYLPALLRGYVAMVLGEPGPGPGPGRVAPAAGSPLRAARGGSGRSGPAAFAAQLEQGAANPPPPPRDASCASDPHPAPAPAPAAPRPPGAPLAPRPPVRGSPPGTSKG